MSNSHHNFILLYFLVLILVSRFTPCVNLPFLAYLNICSPLYLLDCWAVFRVFWILFCLVSDWHSAYDQWVCIFCVAGASVPYPVRELQMWPVKKKKNAPLNENMREQQKKKTTLHSPKIKLFSETVKLWCYVIICSWKQRGRQERDNCQLSRRDGKTSVALSQTDWTGETPQILPSAQFPHWRSYWKVFRNAPFWWHFQGKKSKPILPSLQVSHDSLSPVILFKCDSLSK